MKYFVPESNPNPTEFEIMPLYGLDPEDARAMSDRMKWELDNAEYFVFLFRPRNKEILQRFIPPPLKLIPRVPLVNIFVQQLTLNGGQGNDSLNYGYLENILSAFVSYKNTIGMYPIAIHIESDIGAMLGREMFGTAKKVGQFEYHKDKDSFSWKVRRRGITLIESSGDIVGDTVDPENVLKLIENPTYHLHQVVGTWAGEYYAYPPRLMKMNMKIRKVHQLRACDNVKMVFHQSPFDPLCFLQPKEILAVSYLNADTKIIEDSLETMEELDSEKMLPYLFSKFDPF